MKKFGIGLVTGAIITILPICAGLLLLGAQEPEKASLADVEIVGFRLRDGRICVFCMKRHPDYLSEEPFGWLALMDNQGRMQSRVAIPRELLGAKRLRLEASDLRDRVYLFSPAVKTWIGYSVGEATFSVSSQDLVHAKDAIVVVQYVKIRE